MTDAIELSSPPQVSLKNPPLPAEFETIEDWKDNADGQFRYRVNQEWEGHLHVGTWDWIALMRVSGGSLKFPDG